MRNDVNLFPLIRHDISSYCDLCLTHSQNSSKGRLSSSSSAASLIAFSEKIASCVVVVSREGERMSGHEDEEGLSLRDPYHRICPLTHINVVYRHLQSFIGHK